MTIAYADIAEEGVIQTLIPNGVSDIDCFLQIALCNVGMRQACTQQAKEQQRTTFADQRLHPQESPDRLAAPAGPEHLVARRSPVQRREAGAGRSDGLETKTAGGEPIPRPQPA